MFRARQHFIVASVVFGLLGISTPAFADEMRVVDVPIYKGATKVSYMKRRGDVRYQVTSDFKTVGNFYAKKLAEQRWTKSAKDNLQRNFWVQTFSKGKVSLEVRVSSGEKGGSEVRLTPQGMMWEEDDQPTPKDLPLPEEATDLEYDDFFESIEFKSPSDVKTVVAFLSTELGKRKWTKAATEYERETFVRMKFTYDKSTLEIDVRAEDAGSEVSIRTKGMQWDGMKAEIERAKKEAEKVAAEESAKKETAEMAAALQKRKDRPKQGIHKLPKLPSEATVVMDGKTFKLSHVIAYEVFEYNEWSTKIVATRKPVKQETLLARLKKTGTDNDEESPPSWPEPYLQVVLDEDDRPWRMNFRAGGTPGSGSGDELTGTALVEDGRARGTVALKEPGSFFEKVYTGEISFDVPVLTRDSTPAKRLAGAPKLANSGKLTIGNKTYKLTHVVAYEMKLFDDPMTTVILTEKPINMRNLTAALGKEAADRYFEFTPQVKLLIDADDNVSSVLIWADNMSLGGNAGLNDEIVIEDGRARGMARMTEPREFMDKTYSFEVSFDLNVLGKRPSSRKRTAGGWKADSYKGLPIPEGHEGMHSEGTPFRTRSNTSVVADLAAVVDFYRNELASGEWGQWKEKAGDAKVEEQTAELVFTGPTGGLMVHLKANGKETAITLVSRDAVAAKAAGMLPSPGKARLFIANDSARESVITVSKREYKIAAGAGAKNPKTGFNWEVAPGNYTIEIKKPGGQLQSEKLKIRPDETMGVIIDASGGFTVIELY